LCEYVCPFTQNDTGYLPPQIGAHPAWVAGASSFSKL